ncbi:hypothetical protein HHE014_08630 [Helicobacter heilmannii]|nr:hypothetical protein HHE014_08630 [Helicobacter heilmannii]
MDLTPFSPPFVPLSCVFAGVFEPPEHDSNQGADTKQHVTTNPQTAKQHATDDPQTTKQTCILCTKNDNINV